MTGYRRIGSRLEGHPTPVLPWVDVATGSLGQGLPDGVGVALAGKYLDELPYRVWVLCGDSEMAEGSIWEALDKASHYKLANLIAIIDVNRLGQRGPTDLGWDPEPTAAGRRHSAPGPSSIDGHDIAAVDQALAQAGDLSGDQPVRHRGPDHQGQGLLRGGRRENWHGKPFPPDMAERAVTELGGERHLLVRGPGRPAASRGSPSPNAPRSSCPPTSGARRWPRARPTVRHWPRWARVPASWPWTAKSATPRSPTCSPRRTRAGTSRCTSRSSSWSPRRSAWGARLPAVRLDLRGVLHPGL